ncbi:MAG TPA: sigma-70 family RNA polymerase sigma factor [Solirubrobacterales bacterium]|nr:sigma-70 family RNA polymerase sigma factor [Solirubrobacterales bacterium]
MSDREGDRASVAPLADAARKRAAVETYARHEGTLRRTARRYSICADDAEDALQRALEILLRKAPSEDPRELIRWTQTVVKHEALAVRRDRERILAGPASRREEPDAEDWVALIPSRADGPPERAERREAVARSREALQSLKPQELRALTLLAEGYSYREIGEITGYSQTKVNRCLAEGRERFRRLLSRSQDGSRCTELGPLLSAFCDGEASAGDAETLREHLRACAHCRATLRAYRAAPAAAAALAPTLPLARSLLDRANEALTGLGTRFGGDGGGTDTALTQIATAGGTRGAGMAALAKLAAVCVGTVGGAAACVATGVVPAPLELAADQQGTPRVERRVDSPSATEAETEVDYEPAQPPPPRAEEEKPQQHHEPDPSPEPTPPPVPEASSGAVEYAPPPVPPPSSTATAPTVSGSSAGAGAAGEFGP